MGMLWGSLEHEMPDDDGYGEELKRKKKLLGIESMLREKFVSGLCVRGANVKRAEQFFDFVKQSYSSRPYHNWDHVLDCADVYAGVLHDVRIQRDEFSDLVAFVVHDVVYDPFAKDNEERSAKLVQSYFPLLGVPRDPTESDVVDAIVRRILATKHADVPTDETKYVVDTDLSILGRSWEEFVDYRAKIRKEYWMYDDVAFTKGTIAFYEGMLARKAIYTSQEFQHVFEGHARENIARALATLKAQP